MIAILLLVAMAVASSIVVYAFVTGLIGGLSSGGNSNLVTISGTASVPSGSGVGVITLSVRNTANSPITGVTITSVTPGVAGVAGLLTVSYNGNAIPQTSFVFASPIPIGASASGSVTSTGNMAAGQGYKMSVIIDFPNGSTQNQNFDVTAQV